MLNFYIVGFKKILSLVKKIFLVIAVYFIVISLFLYFLNKDKPKLTYDPIQKNREEIYKVINDPKFKNTQEGKITIALYRGMLCGLIGEACTDNPKDGDKNFNYSLFGFMTNLIVLPYANPPASGVYWAYSGLQNAGFVPKTYAAEGIGFAAIKPFMNIWIVFRNISYMLLVLVLITIGFMIMFRAKLNPQTVISIENSLPKIVVSLLLITFSFALAGLLIDLMYVVILIAISILSNLNIGDLTPTNQSNLFLNYTNNGFNQLWPPGTSFISYSIGAGLLDLLGESVKLWLYGGIGIILTMLFSNLLIKITPFAHLLKAIGLVNIQGGVATLNVGLGEFFYGIIAAIFFTIISLIISPFVLPFVVSLLIGFTIIFLMFRIFFILLISYMKIIFYIILSPLLLILETIPGKNAFSSWFKNLFSEIFTFPLVIIIFLIGYAVMKQSTDKGVWAPPFLYSIDPSFFSTFIGLGIVLITPDLIKIFKESLGAKGVGVEIGLGTFFGGVGAAWGGAQAGMGMFSSFAQAPFIGTWLHQRAGKEDTLGKMLKGMLGPSQAEMFAKELEKRGIGKP